MANRVRYKLVFEIPGLPRMQNTSGRPMHWAIKAKEKTQWQTVIAALVPFRNRPAAPLRRARLCLTRFSVREPDHDGLVSGFKHIIDALVMIKVLENDRRSNIGSPTYDWQKEGQKLSRIRVELEEVFDDEVLPRPGIEWQS